MAAIRPLARAAGAPASDVEPEVLDPLAGKTALEAAAIEALETAGENVHPLEHEPPHGAPLPGELRAVCTASVSISISSPL